MSGHRLGFWSLIKEFAPAEMGGVLKPFSVTADVITAFVATHPAWDGTPLHADHVQRLLLEASAHDPGFPWTVEERGGALHFAPR